MERKLASVQIVESVEPIEGADSIEKIRVLGWTLVARKDEFEVGDKCIYFEVDSVLPENSPVYGTDFSFLASSKYRLKAKKLRGIVSMGLAIPTPDPNMRKSPETGLYGRNWEVGEDVTAEFGVTKWEPVEALAMGDAKGTRPVYFPKTDEIRIQTIPNLFNELTDDDEYYATVKYDGTSASFFIKDGEFGVCSRNMELKESDSSRYWAMAKKYKIQEHLATCGENLCISGEICGPGIQKNRMGLKEVSLFVFDIFDIDKQEYFSYEKLAEFLHHYDIPMVKEWPIWFPCPFEKLLEQSKGKYESGYPREGIVVRSKFNRFVQCLQGRLSFKVINPDFLLKE